MARWNPSWHLCLSGHENGVNPSELLGELAELYPQMNTDDLQERWPHSLCGKYPGTSA